MLPEIFLLTARLSFASDPITLAEEYYKKVDSYRVTLNSKSRNSSEIIRYYFKRPGFVRMEFIKPYKGAILVYDPETKTVRLRPFEFLKFFVLTLKPENRLIISAKGHRVDSSDIGALLGVAKRLGNNGHIEVKGKEDIGGRGTILVSIDGKGGFSVEGIGSYLMWLDKNIYLPLKVVSYDIEGEPIEEVLMDDLEINPEFPEDFFTIDR